MKKLILILLTLLVSFTMISTSDLHAIITGEFMNPDVGGSAIIDPSDISLEMDFTPFDYDISMLTTVSALDFELSKYSSFDIENSVIENDKIFFTYGDSVVRNNCRSNEIAINRYITTDSNLTSEVTYADDYRYDFYTNEYFYKYFYQFSDHVHLRKTLQSDCKEYDVVEKNVSYDNSNIYYVEKNLKGHNAFTVLSSDKISGDVQDIINQLNVIQQNDLLELIKFGTAISDLVVWIKNLTISSTAKNTLILFTLLTIQDYIKDSINMWYVNSLGDLINEVAGTQSSIYFSASQLNIGLTTGVIVRVFYVTDSPDYISIVDDYGVFRTIEYSSYNKVTVANYIQNILGESILDFIIK